MSDHELFLTKNEDGGPLILAWVDTMGHRVEKPTLEELEKALKCYKLMRRAIHEQI